LTTYQHFKHLFRSKHDKKTTLVKGINGFRLIEAVAGTSFKKTKIIFKKHTHG